MNTLNKNTLYKNILLFLIILPFPLLAAGNESISNTFASSNFILSHLIAFGLGFLASLTPCVLPLVPIVVVIFGAKKGESRLKNFLLAFVFVQGMATLYTSLGILAALTGSTFGSHNSSAIFNVIIAFIFIYLGLVFSGYMNIPIPNFIQQMNSKSSKAGFLSAYIMGIFSGILAASCSAPAYFVILEMIRNATSVSGASLAFGISLSYFFSLGIGFIFILVAVFGLSLPKSGNWQGYIKKGGTLVLFSAALFYLSHSFAFLKTSFLMKLFVKGGDSYLLPIGYELAPHYFFAVILALVLLAFAWLISPSAKEEQSRKGKIKLVFFYIITSLSIYFLADSFNNIQVRGQGKLSWLNKEITQQTKLNKIPANVLIDTLILINKTQNSTENKLGKNKSTKDKIKLQLKNQIMQIPAKFYKDKKKEISSKQISPEEFFSKLKAKPILIDFWADWCASCKELEKNILKHPLVAKELENFYIVRADVTHDGKMEKELQKRFSVVALPTLAFIDKKGTVKFDKFLQGGHISISAFLKKLKEMQL